MFGFPVEEIQRVADFADVFIRFFAFLLLLMTCFVELETYQKQAITDAGSEKKAFLSSAVTAEKRNLGPFGVWYLFKAVETSYLDCLFFSIFTKPTIQLWIRSRAKTIIYWVQ